MRRVIGNDIELTGDPVSLSEPCTVCAGSYGWRMLCGLTLPSSFAASLKCTPVYMLISQYMYLLYVKYISRRILLMPAIFYCS